MAGPGTYTAYSQLKPLEGDISNDIQQQEENGFKRRTLKLQEDKFAQDKADAIEAKNKPIKSINAPISEYVSHNKRVLDLFNGDQNFIGEYVNTQLALQKDPYNSKLIEKNINMENTIEQIANAQKGIAGKTKALSDGLASGELSPSLNKDYIQNYNSLMDATGYSYKFNKDTGVTTVVRPDANGDGVPDEFSLQDAYDPTKLTSFKKKFKDDTYLVDAKKRYGVLEDVKDGVTGAYIKTTIKGFDKNKIPDLKSEVNSLFGNDVSKMTDEAKSYLADTLNVDPSTIDAVTFSKVKNDFAQRLLNSYDTIDKKEFDSGDQNADQSRAQLERHYKQTRADDKAKSKKGDAEEFLGSNNFTKPGIAIAKNGSDSKDLVIAGKVVEGIKGSKVYSLKGTNLTRKIGEKGANEIVENIYVLPSGELALKGYKVDGTVRKGANNSSNTTDFFYRTKSGDAEAGAVLDFISKKKNPNTNDYYKSIDEFKEVVTGGKPKNAPKKQESNTIKSGYTEGGYRFKGGNANDPKNWEKI